MSFQQGLSGLSAAGAALDVIGNNVANSSTAGFKSGEAAFADLFAGSLSGGANTQVGSGVGVAAIQQQFSQGNLTTTNNPLDLAINGNGFFRMHNSGSEAVTYTRNGQFHLDKNGYVINDHNLRLTGYNGTGGTINPTMGDLKLSASLIPAQATNQINAGINLDSRDSVPTAAFDPTDLTSYNFSNPVGVFDSLGNPHSLTTYFVNQGGRVWNVYATLGTDAMNPVRASPLVGTLTFSSAGALTTVATLDAAGAVTSSSATKLTLPAWDITGGASTPWSPGIIDLTDTTQFGNTSTVNSLTQDGYSAGSLSGLGVSGDGLIQGRYSNGQSLTLGQVQLATFADTNGLVNVGNNQWNATAASGPELIGAPGDAGHGAIQSSTLEDSNVDLTTALVDMITAQRSYQANAQTIKTQDQVIQTLLNLR